MNGRVAERAATIGLLVVLAVGRFGSVLTLSSCAPTARPEKPNLVLISLDTTRRDHLSIYGYERDTTPNLARLAEEGVTFDGAITAATNTAPAHASIFTGLYPATHGVLRNGDRLKEGVATLALILEQHGYATAGFVSGGTLKRHTGLDRGFDLYDDEMRVRGQRNAELTLAAALPWLGEKAASKGPFFLFFHLFDPHYPYDPPEEYAVRFLPQGRSEFRTVVDRRPPGPKSEWNLAESEYQEFVSRYDGEIAYADHHLGLLMDELGRLGVVDDTLVVFTSDHGETLHEREWVFDHGGRAYDEQIRVPLVIRLPGGRHAGRRVASQVGHVDYLATILEILDIPAPDVAGRSVVGLLEQGIEDDRSRPAFAHARHARERVPETGALLRGDGFISVIRLPTLKLIEYPIAGGRWFSQLFDLRSDPGETRNLAAERVEVVDRLHEALDRWRISTGGYEIIPPQPLRPDVEETLRALGYIE